jgi:uncharacterized protein
MKIVVAGGSGFLGRALVGRLSSGGHEVIVLSRTGRADAGSARVVAWQPDGTAGAWAGVVDGADALVNLAGESIADGRWTARRKLALEQSRVLSTRSLVGAIARASRRPPLLISGSAVGYYGDTADRVITENEPPGRDFLAGLCVTWEAEARQAEALGSRVALIRTGIVLARDGGALKKLLPPFLMFVGGPIASGRQFMPWIHRDDWLSLVTWLVERRDASGHFNLTAPNPVSNREFSRALGRALHRPSVLPVPGVVLRLLFGEMADVALINGQRVVPRRALDEGFVFRYPTIESALAAV